MAVIILISLWAFLTGGWAVPKNHYFSDWQLIGAWSYQAASHHLHYYIFRTVLSSRQQTSRSPGRSPYQAFFESYHPVDGIIEGEVNGTDRKQTTRTKPASQMQWREVMLLRLQRNFARPNRLEKCGFEPVRMLSKLDSTLSQFWSLLGSAARVKPRGFRQQINPLRISDFRPTFCK